MKPVDAAETLTAKEIDRVEEILDLWDEANGRGEKIDLRSLCADMPHIQEIIEERIRRLHSLDKRLAPSADISTPNRKSNESADTLPAGEAFDARLIAQSEVMDLEYHDAGGLGKVYRATDYPLNRQIAVKLIRRRSATDEEHRRDFLREAEITGRLEHPGVVSIYAIGETIDGRCFYTMPMLRGGSFDGAIQTLHEETPERLRPNTPEFRDLIIRLISVCKTIAYAHSRCIAHRDLKPQNIMLGRYGETVVIDWGMAGTFERSGRSKEYDEETIDLKHSDGDESSARGYTLQYASPEQLRGVTTLGPSSDIYSLGVILYKILTGQTPFSGHRASDARQLALSGQIPEIGSLKRGVPKALRAICLQAMALRPENRYSSALELAEDLERYLADAPVTARHDSVVERVARFGRKRWQFAIAVLFGLSVLTIGSMLAALNQGVLRHQAVEASERQLQTATTMAAQAGAAEIDRRWRMLELEAASTQLRQLLLQVESNPQDRELWKQVQSWLQGRFIHYLDVDGVAFDSWFVNVSDGTQVARTPIADSIGGDYSYRAYFHGQGLDLPSDQKAAPGRNPVLSTVYTSTNSGIMKVAFTVPIWENEGGPTDRVIGRLGMSVQVGDLQIFGNLDSSTHLPLLIETRRYQCDAGDAFGLIIDRSRDHQPIQTTVASSSLGTSVGTTKVDELSTSENSTSKKSSFEHLAASALEPMMNEAVVQQSDSGERLRTSARLSRHFIDPFQGEGEDATTAAYCPIRVPGRPLSVGETGWLVVLQARQPR